MDNMKGESQVGEEKTTKKTGYARKTLLKSRHARKTLLKIRTTLMKKQVSDEDNANKQVHGQKQC